MRYFELFIVLLTLSCTNSQNRPQGLGEGAPTNRKDIEEPKSAPKPEKPDQIKVDMANIDVKKISPINSTNTNSPRSNATFNVTSKLNDAPKVENTIENNTTELESGAMTRGVLVFLSITLLFIMYSGFQTYRRRKQDKSRVRVRKYGVRTNRSDLEMEPLPLSDDDEDETVFDLTASRSNHN